MNTKVNDAMNAPQRISIPGIPTPVLAHYVVTAVKYDGAINTNTIKRHFRRYDAALAYYNLITDDECDTKEIRVSAVVDSHTPINY